jgi:predicted DNA-binding transcriptional regulator YafY
MKRIIEVCKEQGIDVSHETIQKDIKMMKKDRPNGFGAPIKFDFQQQEYLYTDPNFTINGVKLTREDASVLEESLVLIKCMLRTELGDKLRHAMEKVLSTSIEEVDFNERYPILKTMEPPRSRGYEFMDLLLECCKVGIPISFVHYSYKNEVFKPVVLHPYVVREFENRWYVFGYSEKHDAYRSFGLDRIYEPIKLDLHYKKGNTKQILSFLNDMYGVFPLTTEEPIPVVLRADRLTTKFLSAYPIHISQVVEKYDFGSSEITLTLIPTMELIQLVRSYGQSLKVVEPKWLVELIRNTRKDEFRR